jgi:SAM-dependent methyltransferase
MSDSYDSAFFEHHRRRMQRSAARLVPEILTLLEPALPTSAVDVGCGAGAFLAELGRRGVGDLVAVEGPWLTREQLDAPEATLVTGELPGVLDHRELQRPFDLALSLEVAEHLPPEDADAFVERLARLAPVVVFSAAVPGQGGTGHVHEAWPEAWAARFAAQGMVAADALRDRVWHDPEIAWWHAQNVLVFAHPEALERHPALAEASRRTDPAVLARVHPTHYGVKLEALAAATDPRRMSLRKALGRLPRVALETVRRRFGGGRGDS